VPKYSSENIDAEIEPVIYDAIKSAENSAEWHHKAKISPQDIENLLANQK